jgi:hypothetical protein
MRRELWMNRTSIEEKPSGERDPWLHEDRSKEELKINGGGERFQGEGERAFGRREHSEGERVKVSEKIGVWLQG